MGMGWGRGIGRKEGRERGGGGKGKIGWMITWEWLVGCSAGFSCRLGWVGGLEVFLFVNVCVLFIYFVGINEFMMEIRN